MKKRKIVLLVDDNKRYRSLTASRLRLIGYEVIEATDGVNAMEVYRQTPHIDVVVTDTNMPKMHGLELLIALRALSHELPVVVMFSGLSGSMMQAEHVRALGATMVIEKGDDEALDDYLGQLS